MRRMVFGLLCMFGFGIVIVIVMSKRGRHRGPALATQNGSTGARPASHTSPTDDEAPPPPFPAVPARGDDEGGADDVHLDAEEPSPVVVEEPRRTKEQIIEDIMAGVSHEALFSMARDRGVSRGLVIADKRDLLASVLHAEGMALHANDPPMPEEHQRLERIAADAFQREEQERAVQAHQEARRTIAPIPRLRRGQASG